MPDNDNARLPDTARLAAAEAEQHLGIPADRVRKWAHRGGAHGHTLYAIGLDNHGRPLYRAADLRRIQEAADARTNH